MARVTTQTTKSTRRKTRPALSPEARENQMISLAIDLAEEQLINGTASSQVITHFLKLGTTRAEIEKEKLKAEIEEKRAKAKAIESEEDRKEMYEKVIKALREYNGHDDYDEDGYGDGGDDYDDY